MQPKLIPARLKEMRESRGMTIMDLHRKSNVSRRQIHEIEAKAERDELVQVRSTTLKRLAAALRLNPDVLSGQASMPPDRVGDADTPKHELSLKISSRTNQRLTLACKRYGLSQEQLIEIAPLLLTLVAEDSFRWRSERLKEQSKLLRRLDGLRRYGQVRCLEQVVEPDPGVDLKRMNAERASIDARELFGESVLTEEEKLQGLPNPFVEYLVEKAEVEIDKDILDLDIYELSGATPGGITTPVVWPNQLVPEYHLLTGEIRKLVDEKLHDATPGDRFRAVAEIKSCHRNIADYIFSNEEAESKSPK